MGDRGDKVVFHLLGGAQLASHVVDGVHQLANFVVLGLVYPHAEIALGNFAGALAQLPHRHQNRPDEIHAGQAEQQQDQQAHRHQDGDEKGDLLVGSLHRDQIPHRADQSAVLVPHHPGDGHHLFPGVQPAHPFALAPGGAQGLLIVGHFLVLVRLKARGGDDHLAVLVQGHNFHVTLVGKALDIVPDNAGKAGGGVHAVAAVREQVEQLVGAAGKGKLDAIVGGALHHQGKGGDGDNQNQQHHAQCVHQPPPGYSFRKHSHSLLCGVPPLSLRSVAGLANSRLGAAS